MNFICEKNILNAAVNPALSTVPSKNFNQSLEGFLLTADKNDGTLIVSSYDMEKGVKVTVLGDNVKIIESGKIIINAEKFSSIVKNMPDGDISVDVDSNLTMTIKNKKSEFTLHGLDGETFPLIPNLKGDKSFKIPRKTLKNMIASTVFAAAVNNSRPAMNGALFEIKNNQLNVIGCDGNRMAIKRSFEGIISTEDLDFKFIVPGKSLAELIKLIGDDDDAVEIELTQKHIIFSFNNIVFFSRLIESNYIDYERAIKIDPKTTVVIDPKNFLSSLERAGVLLDDKNRPLITLDFKKEEINIGNKDDAGILQITSSSSLGNVCDECDIDIYGEDLKIGFNKKYLAEALKPIKENKILLSLESATKSLVILPYDEKTGDKNIDIYSSKFLYLVLPVRLAA